MGSGPLLSSLPIFQAQSGQRWLTLSERHEGKNKPRVARQPVQNWVDFPFPSNTWNRPTARLG